VPGDQRLGPRDVDVVQLELPLAADLERVAETRGGDEPGARALALDERVGEERGGVHDAREARGGQALGAQDRRDAGRYRAGGIVVVVSTFLLHCRPES
jgi:hypothetical protein